MLGGYYRFYAGDYLKDTLCLTMEQDGAYRRLLDHYYTGQSIPSNDKAGAFRIARAHTEGEQKAVLFVLKKYFLLDGDIYRNKRADIEMEKLKRFAESQSEKGKKGGRPRKAGDNPGFNRGLTGEKPEGKPEKSHHDLDLDLDLDLAPDPDPDSKSFTPLSGKKAPDDAEDEKIPYTEIIQHLNSTAGKNYNPKSEAARKHIRARWKEGARIEQFLLAIDNQVRTWKGTEWEKYLRPITLFLPGKFDGYVNNTGAVEREPKGFAAIRALREEEGRT